jgi:hypothetical protein
MTLPNWCAWGTCVRLHAAHLQFPLALRQVSQLSALPTNPLRPQGLLTDCHTREMNVNPDLQGWLRLPRISFNSLSGLRTSGFDLPLMAAGLYSQLPAADGRYHIGGNHAIFYRLENEPKFFLASFFSCVGFRRWADGVILEDFSSG